jgi:GAF domain-containing protein
MSSGHDNLHPGWEAAPMPPDELERLSALREYQILDTPPEQGFDDLTWLASFICQTPMALVTLIDHHRQWFKARVGIDIAETPRTESICAHAVLKPDRILEVPDASKDRRFAGMPAIASGPGVRFYAGAPLVGVRGHALGTICVMDRQPRTLSDDQRHALQILAAQAVSQLELRLRLRTLENRRP